jgi:molecular chaperone DnaK
VHPSLPVLAKAVGIKRIRTDMSSHDRIEESFYVLHMLHAGLPVPIWGRELLIHTEVPDQTLITIDLYEQAGEMESPELEANRLLESCSIFLNRKLPAHSPISITMEVDPEGALGVRIVELTSGHDLIMHIKVDVMNVNDYRQLRSIGD